jgi:hypothetical protein
MSAHATLTVKTKEGTGVLEGSVIAVGVDVPIVIVACHEADALLRM